MPRLLKKISEQQITRIGMYSEILAYLFITLSGILLLPILFLFGIICYGFGDSIFTPVFNGQLSNSVSENQQGLVMGGTQSIQSLSRVIGPLIAGQLLSRSTISSDDIRVFAYDFCLLLLQYKTLVSFATSYKFSVSTDKTKYCVKFFF